MLADLSSSDLDFLDGIRSGLSANEYARRHHYSIHWAKWKSKRIRGLLGVETIQEAVTMSEVTRADLDRLQSNFNDALDKLAKALTPAEKEEARTDAKNAGADLDFELKLLGLSRKDLAAFAEEKRQRQIDAAVDARFKAREEEEAARRKAEEDAAKNGETETTLGQKIRDGLGGKTWAQS